MTLIDKISVALWCALGLFWAGVLLGLGFHLADLMLAELIGTPRVLL